MAARANELINFGRELLAQTSSSPRLDAEVLLSHASGFSKEEIYSRDFEEAVITKYKELIRSRKAGKPVAYIIGAKEFFGHQFAVDPNVLIPRPESEWLVATALKELSGQTSPKTVVDVGTGSGCLIISIAMEAPEHRYIGIDISPEALEIAKMNSTRLDAQVEWMQSDLLSEFDQPIDLLISNPPYLSASEYSGELTAEPRIALVDEENNVYDQLLATEKFTIGLFEMKAEQLPNFTSTATSYGYRVESEAVFGVGFAKVWK